jgi:hypothetical protein
MVAAVVLVHGVMQVVQVESAVAVLAEAWIGLLVEQIAQQMH